MRKGIELIAHLCTRFGPTSCEEEVARAIEQELKELPVSLQKDAMGNLVAHVPGPVGAPRVMLSAHMDEVGFMITEIDADGFLRFDTLGGIDPCVLCGRSVLIGDEDHRIPGVIAAKGIHLQDREERKKLPTLDELYVDIGAKDRADAETLVSLGDFGVFDTPFATFGKDDAYLRGKALDDRVGCALLIEIAREVANAKLPLDLYLCFTVREEIGKSGATVTANRISPDVAIVLETTAIADLAKVKDSRRVANVGEGGVLSLVDRSTIYDRALIDSALDTAARHGIPVQIKRYVSGGNDASHIQRSGDGVRCLALSLATRYLHAPVAVAAYRDYESMRALLLAMLNEMGN